MADSRVREITVIIVSWRDAGDVDGALEALSAARSAISEAGLRASLVVVDNGGGLAGGRRVGELWPDAALLTNESNRGFGPAANQAARAAAGDVLLFVNPDTRAQSDALAEIARAFDENPETVAVAPRLLDFGRESSRQGPLAPPGEEDQRTFQLRRLPTLASDARHLLLFDHLFPNNPARRRERYAQQDREASFFVEQAAGAALAVRREAFFEAGAFDERFFPAWFEDVDLCARLAERGSILFWPAARFRHRGRASSEALGYARFLPIYYRNALRYRERYTRPARWIYRALLAAGMLLRLGALPLRRRMPRRRRDAALAYLRTLAVALGHTPRSCQLSAVSCQLP